MESIPDDVIDLIADLLLDQEFGIFSTVSKAIRSAAVRGAQGRVMAHLRALVGRKSSYLPEGLVLAFRPSATILSQAPPEKDVLARRARLVALFAALTPRSLDNVFGEWGGAEAFVTTMVRYARPETYGVDRMADVAGLALLVPGFRFGKYRDEWGRSLAAYLRAKIRVNARPGLRSGLNEILRLTTPPVGRAS